MARLGLFRQRRVFLTLHLWFPAILLIASSPPAVAGNGAWTGAGPSGGEVTRIAVSASDPNIVYAAVNGTIFRTSDGGASWTPPTSGIPTVSSYYIGGIVIDPANPDIVYVQNDVADVYRSTDGGVTYSPANTGLGNVNLEAIAMDPGNSSRLYALEYQGDIYVTSNSGSSWSLAGSIPGFVPNDDQVFGIAVVPGASTVLYVWARTGVYRSDNSGATWVQKVNGLSGSSIPSIPYFIEAFAVDPSDSNVAYAIIYGGQLFRTDDRGETWGQQNALGLAFGTTLQLLVDPITPANMYIGNDYIGIDGLYRSTDAGVSWTPVAGVFDNVGISALAISPSSPATLYAGLDNGWGDAQGIFVSTNNGVDWAGAANAGMNASRIRALAIDSSGSTLLAGGTDTINVIDRSVDGGASWSASDSGVAPSFQNVSALAIYSADNNRVYAGVGIDVFGSTDGGSSWIDLNVPTNVDIEQIVIDPTDPNIVYFTTATNLIHKSTDGGVLWGQITTGLPASGGNDIAIDPATPTTLYAAGNNYGVYKTTTGGANWFSVNAGDLGGTQYIEVLGVNPGDPLQVFAGGNSEIFRTVDGGASWARITGIFGGVQDFAFDPDNALVVYAVTDLYRYRSVDGGLTWSILGTVVDGGAYSIVADPTGLDVVYVGSADRGVQAFSLQTDLSLSIGDAPDPVAVGGTLSYTATIDNTGPASALVTFTATLPSGVTLGSATPDQGEACIEAGGTVTCNLGGILPGADASVTIDVTVDTGGTKTLTASVSGDIADADLADNSTSVDTQAIVDTDGDGIVDSLDPDDDNDGVLDGVDNCPLTVNPDQIDNDLDGIGDACDGDDDNDGVADLGDNCPLIANAGQLDTDGDGFGNVCDADDDADGVSDIDELAAGLDPLDGSDASLDYDGDGFSNGVEATAGTDINDASVTPLNAGAGLGFWKPAGPPGGISDGLSIDPTNANILYSHSYLGPVSKSTDGGASWTLLTSLLDPPHNGSSSAVAIDPSNPSTLIVGRVSYDDNGSYLIKSTDGGASWTGIGHNFPQNARSISFVRFAPSNSAIVYTFASRYYSADAEYGYDVGLSVDGGASWQGTEGVFGSVRLSSINDVAVAPGNATVLWARGYGLGIRRSANSGASWDAVNNGLPSLNVESLVVLDALTALTTARDSTLLWRTTDGGASWAPVDAAPANALPIYAKDVTIAPSNSATMYAYRYLGSSIEIYRTINAGIDWFPMGSSGLPDDTPHDLQVSPSDSGTLYMGLESSGVYKSLDGGDSWTAANDGHNHSTMNALALDASGSDVYAGIFQTSATVVRSPNAGQSWLPVTGVFGNDYEQVTAIVADPLPSGTLLAARANNVYRSIDAGASWTDLAIGFAPTGIETLVVDPANPSNIFASSYAVGIRATSNGGATWGPANNGLPSGDTARVRALAIAPGSVPLTLYAGTQYTGSNSCGVYKSIDAGASWALSADATLTANVCVTGIAIDPSTPSTLYAISGSTVYKSLDSGASWASASTGLSNGSVVLVDPTRPHVLYASGRGGVVQSIDAGESWQPLGSPPGYGIFGLGENLLLGPSGADVVYVGTSFAGAFAMHLADDLAIEIGAAPNPAITGAPLVYTLTVSNAGPAGDPAVAVTHTLPAGADFVSAIPSQGDPCVADGGVVSCALGGLASGGGATITVTVTPTVPGAVSTSASVDGVLTELDDANNVDALMVNADGDADGDGIADSADPDDDNDSVLDNVDNCPLTPNADQLDGDGDGIGDVCDGDIDNDGAPNATDNCPAMANAAQLDADLDGIGNVCDPDDDNDGVTDEQEIAAGMDPLNNLDALLDYDGDGFSNGEEARVGSDINDATETPQNVAAGRGVWRVTGPGGIRDGKLLIDRIDGDNIFIHDLTNAFRSNDGGDSWAYLNDPLIVDLPPYFSTTRIRAVALDPAGADTLYAAIQSGPTRIAKSMDGGASWIAADNGFPIRTVYELVVAPSDGNTVYAIYWDGAAYAVARSTDGAASWTEQGPISGSPTEVFAVAPDDPDVLYVLDSSGVRRSPDGGASWSSVNTGLPTSLGSLTGLVAIDANTLIVNGYQGDYVYETANAGTTWQPVDAASPNPLAGVWYDLQPALGNPMTLYARSSNDIGDRLARSTDGGATWTFFGGTLPDGIVESFVSFPLSPETFYVLTSTNEVLRSRDGGLTWQNVTADLVSTRAVDLERSTADGALIALVDRAAGFVYRSADAGFSWASIDGDLPRGLIGSPRAIAVDPSDAGKLYLAADANVYRTSDGGASWTGAQLPAEATSLIVDPSTPSTLFAGTWDGGVYRSIDSGASWGAVNNGLPGPANTGAPRVVADPNTSGTFYALYDLYQNARGLYRTVNSGASWSLVSDGVPGVGLMTYNSSVVDLVSPPGAPGTLYVAGGSSDIYRSTDNGVSWDRVFTSGGINRRLALDPDDPQIITVAHSAGLHRSTDGGLTWNPLPAPSGAPADTLDLLAGPAASGVLYIGSEQRGVQAMQVGTDFTVEVVDTPDPVTLGAALSYAATISNDGTVNALAVTFSGALSDSLIVTDIVSSQGSPCAFANGELSCDLGALAPGAQASVTITADTTMVGVVQSEFALDGDIVDATPADRRQVIDTLISPDTDGDGQNDALDPDDDNDGVADLADNCSLVANASQANLDGDVFGDACDTDIDGDGMPNDYELRVGLNPFDASDLNGDPDSDGLTTAQEFALGTNPTRADTDGDGVNDGDEIAAGTNPKLNIGAITTIINTVLGE